MATEFNTQVGNGKHCLRFETDSREYYLLMQETARRCVDGEPVTNADRIRITNGVTVQEWISVKDRLPEQPPNIVDEKGRSWFTPDIDCIVCDGKSVFAAHYCFQNKFFWYANSLHPLKNITHWMPLPEPPKEG